MTTLTYKDGVEINQVTRQQITLRGKGDGAFAFAVNKEVSLLPPSESGVHHRGHVLNAIEFYLLRGHLCPSCRS